MSVLYAWSLMVHAALGDRGYWSHWWEMRPLGAVSACINIIPHPIKNKIQHACPGTFLDTMFREIHVLRVSGKYHTCKLLIIAFWGIEVYTWTNTHVALPNIVDKVSLYHVSMVSHCNVRATRTHLSNDKGQYKNPDEIGKQISDVFQCADRRVPV